MLVGTIEKDPDVKTPVKVDWTNYIVGDSISGTPSWSVANGLTIEGTPAFASNVATAIISGGQEGLDYLATCHVDLASGASEDATVIIKVRTRETDPRLTT